MLLGVRRYADLDGEQISSRVCDAETSERISDLEELVSFVLCKSYNLGLRRTLFVGLKLNTISECTFRLLRRLFSKSLMERKTDASMCVSERIWDSVNNSSSRGFDGRWKVEEGLAEGLTNHPGIDESVLEIGVAC